MAKIDVVKGDISFYQTFLFLILACVIGDIIWLFENFEKPDISTMKTIIASSIIPPLALLIGLFWAKLVKLKKELEDL